MAPTQDTVISRSSLIAFFAKTSFSARFTSQILPAEALAS